MEPHLNALEKISDRRVAAAFLAVGCLGFLWVACAHKRVMNIGLAGRGLQLREKYP